MSLSLVPTTPEEQLRLRPRLRPSSEGFLTSSPDALHCVQWRDSKGTVRTSRPTPALLQEPMAEAISVRSGGQYQNRRNRHGSYYWHRTDSHVWHESALELATLIELDFRGDAVQIVAQPFRLLFGSNSRPLRYHDPDFFAVHANGDQFVYDVKPLTRISARVQNQFDETAQVCAAVGWQHAVITETATSRVDNLNYLRAWRHRRCHPNPELYAAILRMCQPGQTFAAAAHLLSPDVPAQAMPFLKHLVWHRQLSINIEDSSIDFHSTITTAEECIPCCG